MWGAADVAAKTAELAVFFEVQIDTDMIRASKPALSTSSHCAVHGGALFRRHRQHRCVAATAHQRVSPGGCALYIVDSLLAALRFSREGQSALNSDF